MVKKLKMDVEKISFNHLVFPSKSSTYCTQKSIQVPLEVGPVFPHIHWQALCYG